MSLSAAHQAWMAGQLVDFMVPCGSTWKRDPFKMESGSTTTIESEAILTGTRFRIRPKLPRVAAIGEEIFGAPSKPEWRSMQLARKAVDEALSRMQLLFLTGYNPHSNLVIDYKNVEHKVREEFLGPDEDKA